MILDNETIKQFDYTVHHCHNNDYLYIIFQISSSGYVTFMEKDSAYSNDMYARRWPTEWIWAKQSWYNRHNKLEKV